jgi:hypothetical protein
VYPKLKKVFHCKASATAELHAFRLVQPKSITINYHRSCCFSFTTDTVVSQQFEIQVYDEFVVLGNTAVLRCHVPAFLKDHLHVIGWLRQLPNAAAASSSLMTSLSPLDTSDSSASLSPSSAQSSLLGNSSDVSTLDPLLLPLPSLADLELEHLPSELASYRSTQQPRFHLISAFSSIRSHLPKFASLFNRTQSSSRTRLESRFSVFSGGALHIRNARASDGQGTYRCLLADRLSTSSPSRRRLSGAGRLIVTRSSGNVPPRMTSSMPSQLHAHSGARFELACAAQAFPAPNYEWLFRPFVAANIGSNDSSSIGAISTQETGKWTRLTGDSTLQIDDGSLVIRSVRLAHQGSYACIASNSLGQERSETRLIVRGN